MISVRVRHRNRLKLSAANSRHESGHMGHDTGPWVYNNHPLVAHEIRVCAGTGHATRIRCQHAAHAGGNFRHDTTIGLSDRRCKIHNEATQISWGKPPRMLPLHRSANIPKTNHELLIVNPFGPRKPLDWQGTPAMLAAERGLS